MLRFLQVAEREHLARALPRILDFRPPHIARGCARRSDAEAKNGSRSEPGSGTCRGRLLIHHRCCQIDARFSYLSQRR